MVEPTPEALYQEIKQALEPRMIEIQPSIYSVAKEFGVSTCLVWRIKHSSSFEEFRPGYREPRRRRPEW